MPLLCSASYISSTLPCLYYALPGPPTTSQARQPGHSRVPEFGRSRVPVFGCSRVPVFGPQQSTSVPVFQCSSVPATAEYQSSSVPIRGEESKRQWSSIIKHKYTSLSYCKFANFVKLVQASSDPSDHLLISFSLLIFVVCYMDAFVVYRFTIHNVHSAFLFSPRSFGFYYLPFNCQQKNQTKVNKRSGLWVLKSTPYFYLCWRFYFLPLVSPVARPNTTRRSGSAIPQSSRNPNCSWPCKNL